MMAEVKQEEKLQPYYSSSARTIEQVGFTNCAGIKDNTSFCNLPVLGIPYEHYEMYALEKGLALPEGYLEARDLQMGRIKKPRKKAAGHIFNRVSQGEQYFEKQPFLYDKSRLFWMWNNKRKCYEKIDETDLLLGIRNEMGVDTIDSKTRSEIVQALKEIGRAAFSEITHIKKYWIQFQDTLVNVKTGEKMPASHDFFVTNPIAYKIGESKETPTIDKLFKEWVTKEGIQDESYVKTLKQIIACCLTPDKFMQRIIALCGSGSNGKGTFIRMIQKILGKENYCASELRQLSQDRFAASATYRKLACFMGEVSYNDLSDTGRLKQMSGEDETSFQFKGKDAITDLTTASFIIATNSLPATPDKSIGFYRRWLIVDFPNQFPIKEGILDSIPEQEIENLCLTCADLLKEMYETCSFENEGTIEQRAQKFEERANPIAIFLENRCEESLYDCIALKDFTDSFNAYLKDHRLRQCNARQIGNMLRNEGVDIVKRKTKDGTTSFTALNNLKFKNTENTENTEKLTRTLIEPNEKLSIPSIPSISDVCSECKKPIDLKKSLTFDGITFTCMDCAENSSANRRTE